MPSIPELPPDSPCATDSVTAYLEFIDAHDKDPASWTDEEIRDYSDHVARTCAKRHQAECASWTVVVDQSTGETRRCGSAVAAHDWEQMHQAVSA